MWLLMRFSSRTCNWTCKRFILFCNFEGRQSDGRVLVPHPVFVCKAKGMLGSRLKANNRIHGRIVGPPHRRYVVDELRRHVCCAAEDTLHCRHQSPPCCLGDRGCNPLGLISDLLHQDDNHIASLGRVRKSCASCIMPGLGIGPDRGRDKLQEQCLWKGAPQASATTQGATHAGTGTHSASAHLHGVPRAAVSTQVVGTASPHREAMPDLAVPCDVPLGATNA